MHCKIAIEIISLQWVFLNFLCNVIMTTTLTVQLLVFYKYKNFCECSLSFLPEERNLTDKLRYLAHDTDVSF